MSRASAPIPLQSRRRQLPAFGRNTKLLLAITTVNSIALVSAGALVNPYLRNMGMSAAFVGLYFSLSAIVQGGASFVGGFLADTFGRRRVWAAGKVMQIGAYLLLASGVKGQWVLAAAVLSGLSQVGVGAVSAFQADASEASWRATYFAIIQTVNSLVSAIAPLAGGLIADRYGAQWAFAGILPLLIIVARMISNLEERPAKVAGAAGSHRATATQTGLRQRLAELARGILQGPYPRTAMAMLAYALLNGVSNGVINITLPLLMRDHYGLGYTGIAGMQTAIALGMVLTVLVGARLADRLGRRKVILTSCSGGLVLFFALPFVATAAQMYGLVFLFGLIANGGNGAFSATIMECVSDESRASFGGVFQGLNAGGMALGSLVAGIAYASSHLLPLYIAASVVAVAVLLMWLFLQETSRPQAVTAGLAAAEASEPGSGSSVAGADGE